MDPLEPFLLPPDVQLTAVADLPEHIRSQVSGDGDFAITRPRARTATRMLSRDAAELVKEFRTAKTVVERDNLFRGLPKVTLERIAALGRRRVYAEGTVIFLRGDPGDSLCGVVSGRVRISASRPGGKEVFLNIIGPGDSFGEIALLDGMARTATATAMMRTELTIIRRDQFFSLLRTEPQLAAHLIQLLCKRVRWTAQLMED